MSSLYNVFVLSETEREFGGSTRSDTLSFHKGDDDCFQKMIGRG